MRWRLEMLSPGQPREGGEKRSMPGDETIAPFSDAAEGGRVNIPIEQPLRAEVLGQRAKGGFGATVNPAIRLDQMNGSFESLARQFGKACGHDWVLKRKVIHALARGDLPAPDPEPAEIAIAVKNHQRLRRRRSHLNIGFHMRLIAAAPETSKPQKTMEGARRSRRFNVPTSAGLGSS